MLDGLCDPAAERGVLAGICNYGRDAFLDIEDIVSTTSFTIDSNQLIYRCLQHIFANGHTLSVDLASIYGAASDLKINSILETTEEKKHLRAVIGLSVHLENVREFAKKIKRLEWARELYLAHQQAMTDLSQISGRESIDEIVACAERPIENVTKNLYSTDEGIGQLSDGLDAHLEHLENHVGQAVGISSGYHLYDMAIGGGFRRKTVNIIAARPKQGKTTLSDNIGSYVAEKIGCPVLNLDTEMSRQDHWHKMLANYSGVKINEIETGLFSKVPHKRAKVMEAADKLRSLPYDYVSIAGRGFDEIAATMRRWVLKRVGKDDYGNTKDCLVIFDYLKLMNDKALRNMQEYQALGFQMGALHDLCVHLDIPILLFLQLNRDGILKETTDAASGSDRIVWLCSNFTIFKKKTEEEMIEDGGSAGNRKMVPVVCRHGAGLEDGDWINFRMHGEVGRINQTLTHFDILNRKEKGEFKVEDDMPFPTF